MYPGKTLPVTIPAGDALEQKRVFLSKHLTGKRYRQLLEWLELFRQTTGPKVHEMPFPLLADVLADWQNVVHPDRGDAAIFGTDPIDEVLTFSEAMQIVYAIINGNRISEDDRKKSESPL